MSGFVRNTLSFFGTDPTKEFKPFDVQINSDRESLEIFKKPSLGSGEQKIYKRREGINKKVFFDFLKNFQEQIPGSEQIFQKLRNVNLDKEIPFKMEFPILSSNSNKNGFCMVFLTYDKHKDINITYIQYEVTVPQPHATQFQNAQGNNQKPPSLSHPHREVNKTGRGEKRNEDRNRVVVTKDIANSGQMKEDVYIYHHPSPGNPHNNMGGRVHHENPASQRNLADQPRAENNSHVGNGNRFGDSLESFQSQNGNSTISKYLLGGTPTFPEPQQIMDYGQQSQNPSPQVDSFVDCQSTSPTSIGSFQSQNGNSTISNDILDRTPTFPDPQQMMDQIYGKDNGFGHLASGQLQQSRNLLPQVDSSVDYQSSSPNSLGSFQSQNGNSTIYNDYQSTLPDPLFEDYLRMRCLEVLKEEGLIKNICFAPIEGPTERC